MKWPEMSTEAYAGVIGEIIDYMGPKTEADPVALLMTFLTGIGCMIGPDPFFALNGAEHGAKIFSLLVGNTASARKGTSFDALEPLFQLIDPDFLRGHTLDNIGSAEGLIAAVDEVAEHRGAKRVWVIEPEFAQILNGNKIYSLSPIIRKAWDTDRLRVVTKKNSIYVDNAHVSVTGHITIEELKLKLRKVESHNGFANRFLYAVVKRAHKLPLGMAIEEDPLKKIALKVIRTIDKIREYQHIEFSTTGKRAYNAWYKAYDDEGNDIVAKLTARAAPYVIRLSVLYALLDGSQTISEKHVKSALAVWNYSQDSIKFIFTGSTLSRDADKLLEAIVNAGTDGLSVREQNLIFSNHKDKQKAALAELLERELVVVMEVRTKGRPKQVAIALGKDPTKEVEVVHLSGHT